MPSYIGRIDNQKPGIKTRLWTLPEEEKPKKRIVGVIPDLHFPFTKYEYLDFLLDTFIERGVTDIVFIGDLVDNYQASDYVKNPEAMNIVDETESAKEWIKVYKQHFPVATVLKGNHDFVRIDRRSKNSGLPSSYLRTFNEIFGIPDTWNIEDEIIIDNVRYTHGEEYGGSTPALQAATLTNISNVCGHVHTAGGVWYISTVKEKRVFGLNVGCLIDDEQYAFAYAKNNRKKNIIGCGVVYSDQYAEFIPYVKKNKR